VGASMCTSMRAARQISGSGDARGWGVSIQKMGNPMQSEAGCGISIHRKGIHRKGEYAHKLAMVHMHGTCTADFLLFVINRGARELLKGVLPPSSEHPCRSDGSDAFRAGFDGGSDA
jgi:hypothetical protein